MLRARAVERKAAGHETVTAWERIVRDPSRIKAVRQAFGDTRHEPV
jgi:hypothetical protein